MATGLAKSLCDAYTVMGEEIDRLRAENERLKATPPEQRQDLHCVVSDLMRQHKEELAALIAEHERLKADAARYRWMRASKLWDALDDVAIDIAIEDDKRHRAALSATVPPPLPPV